MVFMTLNDKNVTKFQALCPFMVLFCTLCAIFFIYMNHYKKCLLLSNFPFCVNDIFSAQSALPTTF